MIAFQPFPSLDNADEDGLLAMGGDLSLNTLVSAYAQGVFPWFNEGQPILWWSPDPRLVLYPDEVKISRSLKKNLKNKYQVTCDRVFKHVVKGCALRGSTPNSVPEGTWITEQMYEAYVDLHNAGYAHSIETWNNDQLVGGLYGVCLGDVFFGESMFSLEVDASKVALVYLCQHLLNKNFQLIDCQVASDHLFTLGAREIPRKAFTDSLVNINIHQSTSNFADDFPTEVKGLHSLLSR
ncbi:MAG: leucyl/phenylalanyl-tRNA--protein transferase [Acidiferrobacterales bacterium]|nr:leucyl/phenylalanyl-tRNA--protein transferase [Acidiferrobacterales bacterium]